MPTLIPKLFWDEKLVNGLFIAVALRWVISVHCTGLVNSAAHMFGYKPYDKDIAPRENKLISWMTIGEGFHNYHHTFPQDYATSEYGFHVLNFTKMFIDTMAFIGLGDLLLSSAFLIRFGFYDIDFYLKFTIEKK
jgi:stearoyl-CoA desaturase (delta-9 desaturase)